MSEIEVEKFYQVVAPMLMIECIFFITHQLMLINVFHQVEIKTQERTKGLSFSSSWGGNKKVQIFVFSLFHTSIRFFEKFAKHVFIPPPADKTFRQREIMKQQKGNSRIKNAINLRLEWVILNLAKNQ